MKCPYCGSNNRDDAVSCIACEMPLNFRARKHSATRPLVTQPVNLEQISQTIEIEPSSYACCPHCGSPLHDCAPVSKTHVTQSGGGYGFFSGCCGTILLGPLGLLCGLKRRTITSSSQTWWVCRKCGKEFIEKEAAKKVVDTSISNAATTTLVIALIWQFIFAVIGYNHWVRDIAILMIIGTWLALPEGIKESTGYAVKQLLNSDEQKDFYKQCALYGIGSFILGVVVGAKLMEFFFS